MRILQEIAAAVGNGSSISCPAGLCPPSCRDNHYIVEGAEALDYNGFPTLIDWGWLQPRLSYNVRLYSLFHRQR